jgi:hypothetical protein
MVNDRETKRAHRFDVCSAGSRADPGELYRECNGEVIRRNRVTALLTRLLWASREEVANAKTTPRW